MKVSEADIRKEFYLNILTVIKLVDKTNLLGIKTQEKQVVGVITPEYLLEQGDILLLFGKIKNIQEFLNLDD